MIAIVWLFAIVHLTIFQITRKPEFFICSQVFVAVGLCFAKIDDVINKLKKQNENSTRNQIH
jgi:hypothetical protein